VLERFWQGFSGALREGGESVAILVFAWLCVICFFVVAGMIARSIGRRCKTWYRERVRYKLPKPPRSYRLN
jgi:hypothetical protein